LYVHDQIYDIKDFFNFQALCGKAENFNATWLSTSTPCYHILVIEFLSYHQQAIVCLAQITSFVITEFLNDCSLKFFSKTIAML